MLSSGKISVIHGLLSKHLVVAIFDEDTRTFTLFAQFEAVEPVQVTINLRKMRSIEIEQPKALGGLR